YAIHVRRQLALEGSDFGALPRPRVQAARRIRRSAARVRGTLIQLSAIRRIGEPDAAVFVDRGIVWRIQPLALIRVRDDGDGSVVLVSHDAAHQVFARYLASLEVEGV